MQQPLIPPIDKLKTPNIQEFLVTLIVLFALSSIMFIVILMCATSSSGAQQKIEYNESSDSINMMVLPNPMGGSSIIFY